MSKLIKCKSCGEEIASDAEACPKCGSPNKKGGCLKTIGMLCAGFVALIVIAAIMSDGGDNSGGSGTTSSSDPTPQEESPVAAEYGIGDVVSFEDSDWTVLEARELGQTLRAEFLETKQTEGKYIFVRYKVLNKTKEQESILFTPAIQDSAGRRFEEFDGTDMYLPEGHSSMTMEQLPAGLPKTFSAIFEVPADASELVFLTRNFAMLTTQEKGVKLGF